MNSYNPNISDILYSSYIRYDRMYEMTKFAFYGDTDTNKINVFVDCYSFLLKLYRYGSNIMIKDSYSIASCLINLAIHIRAYFETRHNVYSKIYLIYGGANPSEAFINYPFYNDKNIFMQNSNFHLTSLIQDNLNIMKILCPYLYDIFCIVDNENEFTTISSFVIDEEKNENPNIVYSKEKLAYQLVAFKPKTFMYRPKKSKSYDISWVVTKSTLYDAYRYAELSLKKEYNTNLDIKVFSIFQAISGLSSRNINKTKNVSTTIRLLENAILNNIFSFGYNSSSIFYTNPNPFFSLFSEEDAISITNKFAAIDLPFQTMLYQNSIKSKEIYEGIINLYNPQELRNINDKYFNEYPLDLNRV